MRERFDRQLEGLNDELTAMGELIEDAIDCAVSSLIDRSAARAAEADELEKEIDQKEEDIENLCLKLLMQQQPVAGDLRLISAALKMITDMERIGDQAADIADICVTMPTLLPEGPMQHLRVMAETTTGMVRQSVEAFIHRDMAMAQTVCDTDDEVDAIFSVVKQDMILWLRRDAEGGETALDLLMIAKYFERIGDHAVNLAEWVVFAITGRHKDFI